MFVRKRCVNGIRPSSQGHGQTPENRELGLKVIAKRVFPQKAALMQKCYVKHFLKKPKGMGIRE